MTRRRTFQTNSDEEEVEAVVPVQIVEKQPLPKVTKKKLREYVVEESVDNIKPAVLESKQEESKDMVQSARPKKPRTAAQIAAAEKLVALNKERAAARAKAREVVKQQELERLKEHVKQELLEGRMVRAMVRNPNYKKKKKQQEVNAHAAGGKSEPISESEDELVEALKSAEAQRAASDTELTSDVPSDVEIKVKKVVPKKTKQTLKKIKEVKEKIKQTNECKAQIPVANKSSKPADVKNQVSALGMLLKQKLNF